MNKEWINLSNQIMEDAFSAFNKMSAANMKAMEKMLETQTGVMNETLQAYQDNLEKLSKVKEPKEAFKVQGEMARSCSEIVLDGFKRNTSVLSATLEEFSTLFEDNVKTAESNIEKLAKTASKKAA